MHILFDLCKVYQDCGMYSNALDVAKEALALDEDDHVGFHTDAIVLHLHLEKLDAVPTLLNGYFEPCAEKMLFETIYHYKKGDLHNASKKIEEICVNYPSILKIFTTKNLTDRIINNMMQSDEAYDIEEFMGVLKQYKFLYTEEGFLDFMVTEMQKFKKNKSKKREKRVLN